MSGTWRKYTFFDKDVVSEKATEIVVSLLFSNQTMIKYFK